MHTVVTLALKDLRLLARDRMGLFWILIYPLMFALFFGAIFSGGSRGAAALPVAVVDEDDSAGSKAFLGQLKKSDALQVEPLPLLAAREGVRQGKLVAYVVLPKGFGEAANFFGPNAPDLEVGIDPSRRAELGYLQGMLTEAFFAGFQERFADPKQFQQQLQKGLQEIERATNLGPKQRQDLKEFLGGLEGLMGKIEPGVFREGSPWRPLALHTVEVTSNENQPRSSFEITFPASILWGILGCVMTFAISIVSERVAGTFLRLRVAPVSWSQVLAGKGLACFLACGLVAAMLLLLARMIFGIRLENPVGLVLGIVCTAGCFSGIMMLVSTLGKTQSAVAGAGWGSLMPLVMLGGGMIPLIAMPSWMRTASSFSPVKWGILALEGAIWRGYTLSEMLLPCGILIAVGAGCFALGVVLLARQQQ
jgi:ABC-2 type transport system permease protein